jgi:long-chain acyl-CoA synthetase
MSVSFSLKDLNRYEVDTFADVIYRNASLLPDGLAFIYEKEKVTFSEYNDTVNHLIKALQSMGAKKGDVLGVLSWNCLEYSYVIGAAMKGGFIVSPYNPRLTADDINYLLEYSTASFVFVGPEFVDTVKKLGTVTSKLKGMISFEKPSDGFIYIQELLKKYPAGEPEPVVTENDPVVILYTSGTTGRPKGAIYTHGRIINNSKINMSNLPINRDEKFVMALQLFHVAAMEHFQVFMYAGGCSIMLKSFDATLVMQTIQEEKANVLALVPTVLAAILALPNFDRYDKSSLKIIKYMGSPMPVALLKQGIDKFGFIFVQQYGLTESGPMVSTLFQQEHRVAYGTEEDQKILSSCGHAVLGVHIRIVDENSNDTKPGEVGELIVRSKAIMLGYFNKPKETSETIIDGWFHTRDLGYSDDKGYLYIVSRKQDMIITGGEHVFPREVEEVLYQHPAVLEAAVIGVPDQYWVERVHAVVTLKQGATCTPEEIMSFCKARISRFKAPKSCEITKDLPKSAAGKILKTELRKAYKEKSSNT